jgi:predicted nucleic acid-binding protein
MDSSPVIVDASVVMKWFLDEPQAEAARELLEGDRPLAAPDLLYAEVGNALWKHVRRGLLSEEEAQAVLDALAEVPVAVHCAADLVQAAVAAAVATDCAVYDGLYVVLAVELQGVLITADRKLFERLTATPLGRHIAALPDVPGLKG